MDVSIIVIAHGVRDEVLSCLASIEQHAGDVDVETILVDNGSRDGTPAAVRNRFPETLIVERPTNEGVAARNHGLRVAQGRFRMFLDSDAQLTADALPELVAFMDSHPDVGLTGPRLVYPDGTLQLSARRFPHPLLPLLRRPPLARVFEDGRIVRRHLMADDTPTTVREVEYVLGACQLFSAGAQHAAGEVEAMFFGPDDADWCFRIREAGFKVAYHPRAVVVHAYRRTSADRPFSRTALRQLWAFARFQWNWRRQRRRLIEEGHAMDTRPPLAEHVPSPSS
jgi:GT2 family glycosyltransferase